MTIVVSVEKDRIKVRPWADIANSIIRDIEKTLMISEIFGEKKIATVGVVQGYTVGYTYGEHPFSFTICFHEAYWRMGVAIKFSAQSLLYYRNEYKRITGAKFEIYDLLKILDFCVKRRNGKVRLSRIDIYADFIDEGIEVNDIKKELVDCKCGIWMSSGKRNISKISYYTQNGTVSTLYIGAKGKNIRTLLRIYDKKLEQIQRGGTRYVEAVKCKDWVRMENEICGSYAHDLTQEILKINTPEEMANLIGTCLLNKYQFIKSNGVRLKITEMLSNTIEHSDYYYKDIRYNDMSLQRSYEYIIKNSGLMPFLYKLWAIDKNAFEWFINDLKKRIVHYAPNRDTQKWMNEHQDFYAKNGIRLRNERGRRKINDS